MTNGYWTYDGEGHYETLEEMWEYIRDNEYYSDELDFERWIDENYRASQIAWMLKDEKYSEAVLLDLMDQFEEEIYSPKNMDDPIEGEDYDYNGFTFEWVDEDEDEEAE